MTSTSALLQRVRRAFLLSPGCPVTDGRLLERFLLQREEAAFGTLVQRYGAMVLGVCRRVLGNVHDAEDAFQATFLVLLQKAHTLRQRETIGNYLHGVAYHIALKARAAGRKRRAKESQAIRCDQCPETDRDVMVDVRRLLDQELSRLPEKYRGPVVLCHLQGQSRQVVARLLGIPEGTLSSRLATARRMLAERLARQGVLPSAGLLAAALAPDPAAAAAAIPLGTTTVKAAVLVVTGAAAGAIPDRVVTLMRGGLEAMRWYNGKTVLMIVLAGTIFAAGVSVAWRRAPAAGAAEQAPSAVRGIGRDSAEERDQPLDEPRPGKLEAPPPEDPAPPPDPAHDRLDAVLRRWEEQTKSLHSLRAHVTSTTTDKTYESTTVCTGTFELLRPDSGRLEMHNKHEPIEKFVWSGKFLYEYVPKQKTIRVHELPLVLWGRDLTDPYSLLLFPKAREVRKRYDLKLVKEDQWYAYIELLPRSQEDKGNFDRARVVLTRSTFLPRQFWFMQPNGNEITWDIPRIERDIRLDRADFDSPKVPAGWRLERLPRLDDKAHPGQDSK
jgi:TIGR03009 family protein